MSAVEAATVERAKDWMVGLRAASFVLTSLTLQPFECAQLAAILQELIVSTGGSAATESEPS